MASSQTQVRENKASRASYWEEVEDLVISNMRSQIGKLRLTEKDWSRIAIAVNQQGVNDRTWKQVKYRWLRHLDPTIIKTAFTTEEEKKVIDAQKQLGNKWTDISQKLPGRTYWQIKNLWFMKLKYIVENNAEITDQVLSKHKSDDYVLKCSDFEVPDGSRKRLSNATQYSACSVPIENNPNGANVVSKVVNKEKHESPKRMKILIPKSETKKRHHLNLLTNIISIPLLYANESKKLDVSTDNESFVGVSPIRITTQRKFKRVAESEEDDLSKFFAEVDQPSLSIVQDLDIDNSMSKPFDIFEGNDYIAPYDLSKPYQL